MRKRKWTLYTYKLHTIAPIHTDFFKTLYLLYSLVMCTCLRIARNPLVHQSRLPKQTVTTMKVAIYFIEISLQWEVTATFTLESRLRLRLWQRSIWRLKWCPRENLFKHSKQTCPRALYFAAFGPHTLRCTRKRRSRRNSVAQSRHFQTLASEGFLKRN